MIREILRRKMLRARRGKARGDTRGVDLGSSVGG